MTDKKALYILSTLIGGLSLLLLVLPFDYSILQPICLFLPASLAVGFFIRKKKVFSINKHQVFLVVAVSVLLRILIHYLLGLSFGMARRAVAFNWQQLLFSIGGSALVIGSSEFIRGVLIGQKEKWASIMAFLIGVSSDILLVSNLTLPKSMNLFMDMVGLTVIPAIIGNVLYQYLAKRYGIASSLFMRFALTVYPVIIPYITFTPEAIVAFGEIALPIFLYLFVSLLYERKRVTHRRQKKLLSAVYTTLSAVLMTLTVMLISCQFLFGALVIGTESMTGELNVGDVAVFERYDGQVIEVGDVIVFKSGSSRIIHRVVEITNIGNDLRYITQGDANEDPDMGSRSPADVIGLVRFKVAYVGYPTVWLNDLFSNAT